MSWDKKALLTKAKLFFERAFMIDREDPLFGLWCSLGLELLARAAVSSVSPTLLAEPDRDQKNILYALGKGSDRSEGQSLGIVQVLSIYKILYPDFSNEDMVSAKALINRRNSELHTGSAAFSAYPTGQWLVGFYKCSKLLSGSMGMELKDIFGTQEAKLALALIAENRDGVKQKVENQIAAHKRVWLALLETKRTQLKVDAEKYAEKIAHQRHHIVACPSCECKASVQGDLVGKKRIEHDENLIIVKQSVAPNQFSCASCNLSFASFSELETANLAAHYIRTTTYTPEEYYGLIDESTIDWDKKVKEYLDNQDDYDNE